MRLLRLLVFFFAHQCCYEAKKSTLPDYKAKQLQADLLQVVGIERKPKVTRGRLRVPKYVMDLYRRQKFLDRYTREGFSSSGTIVRTFFRENIRRLTTKYRLLTFKLSTIPPSEKLVTAELRIFARRPQNSAQATKKRSPGIFKISLFQLGRRWRKDGKWKRKSTLAAHKVVRARRYGEWLSFNVTKALMFWQKYPGKNHGFWIVVKAHNAKDSDFRIATGGRKEPILVTFGVDRTKLKQVKQVNNNSLKGRPNPASEGDILTKAQKRTRNKRSTSNTCQRHKLVIKFRDVKWDRFIIAPPHFSAYYCKGECPEVIDQYFNPTNHAIIQNIFHHRYDSSIPAVCCVPTKLNSISLLYYETDGSIVLKQYKEMVASSCGCR